MRKTLMALAAVATLAVSAVGAPAPAHAQRYLGAAIAGGLIGGAIVGAAAAPYYYGYGPGYYRPYGPYGYYGPAYVAAPGCYGGGSVSGTAMAGASVTCGSAVNPVHLPERIRFANGSDISCNNAPSDAYL